MTLNEFQQTPRYQAYCIAGKGADAEAQARIMQEAIAQTTGEENEFWLNLQQSERFSKVYSQPANAVSGWAELEESLSAGHITMKTLDNIVLRAVGLYFITERSDLWARLFPKIWPHMRSTRQPWGYYYHLGQLRLRQRRWRAAYAASTRSMAYFQTTCALSRSDYWIYLRAQRALAAVAIGRLDMATTDVAQAIRIAEQYDPTSIEPYDLALAQAELALAQGRFQAARAALQEGMAGATISQYKPAPIQHVDFDLAAARIARAEGRMPSFRHFCDLALNRCLEWELHFSEARVRAIMAGADR